MIRTDLIRPVPELLVEHAANRSEQIAFSDEHRQVSYRELARNTARLAGALADLGLAPGDRALLYLDNSVATVEAYLAVPRAGGVAVCANPASAPAEVAHVLHDSGAAVVITDAVHLDTVRALTAASDPRPVVVTVGADSGAEHGEYDYASLLASPRCVRSPRLPGPGRRGLDALHVRHHGPWRSWCPGPRRWTPRPCSPTARGGCHSSRCRPN